MQIAYYDESGDDGFPTYSSPFFVLSALYLHYLNWRSTYETILNFRRDLKTSFGLPIRLELHTKHFVLNKHPYRDFNIADADRLTIIDLFCDLIASLEVKIINVVILKPRIKRQDYQVLDTALKYSVQRIENDLNPALNPSERFMIITDTGRVGKMRNTCRRIQRINFIPSKFSPSLYRREITSLIEDPLPKDSKESYFIQLADLVSYVIYLHTISTINLANYPNRLSSLVSSSKVAQWMDRLKPAFNLNASSKDPFGIVYHPQ